jgi:hypothetical protein
MDIMKAIGKLVIGVVALFVLSGATTLPAHDAEYPTIFAYRPTAEELEERAQDLLGNRDRYSEAARLLVRAAEMREQGDPKRIANFRLAGRLQFYARSIPRARSLFERAAAEALAVGHVFEAADALLDASSVSFDLRDYPAASDLLRRAELLALSPLLTSEERAFLERRINGDAD